MATTIETVYAALDSLLDYAKDCELLHPLDETFARNSLLTELKLESYEKQTERHSRVTTPLRSAICLTQSSWAA